MFLSFLFSLYPLYHLQLELIVGAWVPAQRAGCGRRPPLVLAGSPGKFAAQPLSGCFAARSIRPFFVEPDLANDRFAAQVDSNELRLLGIDVSRSTVFLAIST